MFVSKRWQISNKAIYTHKTHMKMNARRIEFTRIRFALYFSICNVYFSIFFLMVSCGIGECYNKLYLYNFP